MRDGRAPYAIRLSEANFGVHPVEGAGAMPCSLPLNAAFCIVPEGIEGSE